VWCAMGVLVGSFYWVREGRGGGREGWAAMVNGYLQWSVTGVMEGGEGGMRPSKEGATELMKGPTGQVLSMAREVGCDQHGVAAVKPGRRRGRRKGREGVQAGGPARGDGPDDQWAGEREKH
jgi:hypothetical protein